MTFNNNFACRGVSLIMENAQRNTYDAAFKLNAIDLAIHEENRASAPKLGTNESMVRHWRLQCEELTQCKKTTKFFSANKKQMARS